MASQSSPPSPPTPHVCAECHQVFPEHMMKPVGKSWLCLPCGAAAAEAKPSGRSGGSGVSNISLDRIPLWGYAIIGLLLGAAYIYTPGGSKNGGGGMPSMSADVAEPWSKTPVAQWPQFTFGNELEVKGIPKAPAGSGFLLQADSGQILGVTHARAEPGLTNAALNERFVSGRVAAAGTPDHPYAFRGFYGPPAAPSSGDIWLLRPADDKAPVPVTPLKIRHMAALGGMRLFIVRAGGATAGKESLIPCAAQEVGGMGELLGITCDTPVSARGLAGAPVVDKSGHLAGIVTGVGDDELNENGSVTSLKTLGAASLERLTK